MTKPLEKCHTGSEICRRLDSNPNVTSIRQAGSHRIYHTDKGMVIVPNHAQDLGRGLWSKIIKACIVLGLGIMAIALVLH